MEVCQTGGPCTTTGESTVIASEPDRVCGLTRFNRIEFDGVDYFLRDDIGCVVYQSLF